MPRGKKKAMFKEKKKKKKKKKKEERELGSRYSGGGSLLFTVYLMHNDAIPCCLDLSLRIESFPSFISRGRQFFDFSSSPSSSSLDILSFWTIIIRLLFHLSFITGR